MEELTNEVLVDGWFHTGDLGYFDKDGYLFITGRNKNLIVLKNGKKVFPEELETMVNKIDLVSESMVYSIPDKEDENDVKVCVKAVYDAEVIKEKYADKSEDELKDLVWEKIKEVNTTFPKYKHIKGLIVSHEELIKTTTKKVKRQEEMKKILEEID
jgi:long-chain acyl-CoA synthetase